MSKLCNQCHGQPFIVLGRIQDPGAGLDTAFAVYVVRSLIMIVFILSIYFIFIGEKTPV